MSMSHFFEATYYRGKINGLRVVMLKDSAIELTGQAVAVWQLYLQDFEAGPDIGNHHGVHAVASRARRRPPSERGHASMRVVDEDEWDLTQLQSQDRLRRLNLAPPPEDILSAVADDNQARFRVPTLRNVVHGEFVNPRKNGAARAVL